MTEQWQWLEKNEYAVVRDNGVVKVLDAQQYANYGDYPNLIVDGPFTEEDAHQLKADLLATGLYTVA